MEIAVNIQPKFAVIYIQSMLQPIESATGYGEIGVKKKRLTPQRNLLTAPICCGNMRPVLGTIKCGSGQRLLCTEDRSAAQTVKDSHTLRSV